LLVRVFVPFIQLHIHPYSFCSQSFHFFSGIPVPLLVLLSLLLFLVFFSSLFSIPSVSYTLQFHPIPSLPRTSIYSLYHALKHHHSPPEITYPLSLSYFPYTSHYLVCVPHYLSHVCLVRDSFVEGVAQVHELTHSFYFPSFPRPLILFTLPLSLVEHHHFRFFNIHFQLFPPHVLSQAPHFSLTLCHYYQVVRKRQAPNLLI
jgi:hypothetical protein